jgi:hypothetical protein
VTRYGAAGPPQPKRDSSGVGDLDSEMITDCSCDDMITRRIFTRKGDLGGRSSRAPGLSLQMVKSPSLGPGTVRSPTSAGQSLIMTMGRRRRAGGRLPGGEVCGGRVPCAEPARFPAALDVEVVVDRLLDHGGISRQSGKSRRSAGSVESLRHTARSPGRPPRGRRTTEAIMCRTRMRPCPDRHFPPRERQTGTETRPRFRAGAKDGHCLGNASIHSSGAGPRNVTPGSGDF